MTRQVIILSLLTFITTALHSQKVELFIRCLPVKNGVIHKRPPLSGTRVMGYSDGVVIKTKTDTCFAIEDGTIASVFNLGDEVMVIAIKHNNEYFSYAQLSTSFYKKGDLVKRGDAIGSLKHREDNKEMKELFFMITNNHSTFRSYKQQINYLRLNSGDCSSVH